MFSNFGTTELLIIAALILLLFGGRKLPELGKGLGESIKELGRAFSGDDDNKKKS